MGNVLKRLGTPREYHGRYGSANARPEVNVYLRYSTNAFIRTFISAHSVLTDWLLSSPTDEKCDDVAVVGAGIAGTFAAWRLRNDQKAITLYEYSDHAGGKMATYKFPGIEDINVELGAMRYLPEAHSLLNKTICDLGLHQQDSDLGFGKSPNTLMYLRGTHLRYKDLGCKGTPYNLRPWERKPSDEVRRDLFYKYTDMLKFEDPKANKFNIRTKDGIKLSKQSAQAFYLKYGSKEVFNYINDASGFYSFQKDVSALISLPSPPSNKKPIVRTVSAGMDSIPKKLMEQFLYASKRHSVKYNHNLIAIKRRYDGNYDLCFQSTTSVNGQTTILEKRRTIKKCAKKVILAVSKLALVNLDWDGLYNPRIRNMLTNSIVDVDKAKLFLAYDYPWWRSKRLNTNYIVSDTPLRHTYDFGTSKHSSKSVLNVMYLDEDVSVWHEIARRDNKNAGVNDYIFEAGNETICFAHKYLSEVLDIPLKKLPKPIGGVFVVWKQYPFGGDWNMWKPGFKWSEVEEQMIKPSKHDDVFLAATGFNARTVPVWSNAALEIVDRIMKRYFC